MLEKICNLLVKDVDFVFDDECLKAFKQLKAMLTSAPIIQPPNWKEPFKIMHNASDYVVGTILGQCVNRLPHVVYCASRTLNDTQLNYYTTELLALGKFRS